MKPKRIPGKQDFRESIPKELDFRRNSYYMGLGKRQREFLKLAGQQFGSVTWEDTVRIFGAPGNAVKSLSGLTLKGFWVRVPNIPKRHVGEYEYYSQRLKAGETHMKTVDWLISKKLDEWGIRGKEKSNAHNRIIQAILGKLPKDPSGKTNLKYLGRVRDIFHEMADTAEIEKFRPKVHVREARGHEKRKPGPKPGLAGATEQEHGQVRLNRMAVRPMELEERDDLVRKIIIQSMHITSASTAYEKNRAGGFIASILRELDKRKIRDPDGIRETTILLFDRYTGKDRL